MLWPRVLAVCCWIICIGDLNFKEIPTFRIFNAKYWTSLDVKKVWCAPVLRPHCNVPTLFWNLAKRKFTLLTFLTQQKIWWWYIDLFCISAFSGQRRNSVSFSQRVWHKKNVDRPSLISLRFSSRFCMRFNFVLLFLLQT